VELFVSLSSEGLFWETSYGSNKEETGAGLLERVFDSICHSSSTLPVIVIVNTASIGKTTVKQLADKREWKTLMLSPKSEELNPASYLFQ